MLSLRLLVPLALLFTVTVAQDKIKAVIQTPSHETPFYQKSATLETIFGDAVTMDIENPLDVAIDIQYKVMVNSKCVDDNEAVTVQPERSLSVAAGGQEVALSGISTPTDDVPCGPACLFVVLTSNSMDAGIAGTGMVVKCPEASVDLALESAVETHQVCEITLGQRLIDQPCLEQLQDLKVVNNGPDAMPVRSRDIGQSVLAFVRRTPLRDEDIVSKVEGDCYYDNYDYYGYGNNGYNYGYSGSWGSTGSTGSSGSWDGSGSWANWGNSGSTGGSGSWGNWGNSGSTGGSGSWGNSGSTGGSGSWGNWGNSGSMGDSGSSGSSGSTGSSGPSGSSGPHSGRKRRSVVQSEENLSRKKRSHNMEAVGDMFDYWLYSQEDMIVNPDDVRNCMSNSFTYAEKDIPLMGGDITLDDGALASGSSVDVSLADVMLTPAGLASMCSYTMMQSANYNNMHMAQLVVLVDPLSLNDDSDLCNNAIIVNITYDCTDHYETYDAMQCGVMVDPMSRGHHASIVIDNAPVLRYYEDKLEYTDSERSGACMTLEYYTYMTEMNRYKLLADRYQRQADQDDQMCMEVELAERSEDRSLFYGPMEMDKRRKRATEDNAENAGPKFTKQTLMLELELIIQNYDMYKDEYWMASEIYCNFTYKLSNQYRKLSTELEDGDLIQLEEMYLNVQAKVFELVDMYSFVSNQYECSDRGELSVEDWRSEDSGDLLKDGAMDDAVKYLNNKTEREDNLQHEGLEEKLKYLDDSLQAANHSCPGQRGRSMSALYNNREKLAEMTKKVIKIKSDEMEAAPLSTANCGQRKLQQVLQRGGGQLINRDIKPFQLPYNFNDYKVMKLRFMSHLKDVLDLAEEQDKDADFVKEETERRMNETAEIERVKCGDSKETQTRRYYEADDTYPIYWKVHDGKVYQGISDVFGEGFGEDRGDGEREVVWKQVTSCVCPNCGWAQTISPRWNDYSYSYYYYNYNYGDTGNDDYYGPSRDYAETTAYM